MKRYLRLLIVIAVLPLQVFGQDQDTKTFTQADFLFFVNKYHPLMKQANLLARMGESTVRNARGGFDPYLYGNLDQKYFKESEYYDILGSGLKIPTWYGIELKAAYERNEGVFLNPENTVPADGLWSAGASITLGKGLFIDKRRATLKQAKIFAESTIAQQRVLVNDFYFEAIKEYWKWAETWNQLKVYQDALDLAKVRFEAVKQSYILGDKPAIDTLEAFIQVQNREMNRNESRLQYQNKTLELSNFLWFENNTPLQITDSLVPPLFSNLDISQTIIYNDSLQTILENLSQDHPQLQLYDYKLSTLDIERRLKAESLKPKINLNYNLLNEPQGGDYIDNFALENYKWGVEFSFPILLREARGNLQLTKIKIQDTEYLQQQKGLEIRNKVLQYYNEQQNLLRQVNLYTKAVNNYNNLLLGERQMFDAGESSLFLINRREVSLISAQIKLMQFISKYNISYNGVYWAAGRLYGN